MTQKEVDMELGGIDGTLDLSSIITVRKDTATINLLELRPIFEM